MTLGSKSGGKPSRKHTSSTSHQIQLASRAAKAYISSGKGAISGSSSSRQIHHTFSKTTGTCITNIQEALTTSKIQARNASDYKEYQERMDSMTTTERSSVQDLYSGGIPADNDDDPSQPAVDIMDILSGGDSMDISRVGGEFADLLALGDDLLGPSRYLFLYFCFSLPKLIVVQRRPGVRDYRARQNRTQCRTEGFYASCLHLLGHTWTGPLQWVVLV